MAEFDDYALMSLYNRLVNWTGYAGGELAVAVVKEKRAERELSRMETLYTVQYKSEKTVAATKARVALEPEYQAAEDDVDACFNDRRLLEFMYQDCERKASAASRELSRRLGRRDVENRNGKMST